MDPSLPLNLDIIYGCSLSPLATSYLPESSSKSVEKNRKQARRVTEYFFLEMNKYESSKFPKKILMIQNFAV